jgi:hypothetical protein
VGHLGHLEPSPSWWLSSFNERLRALKSFLFFGEKREHGSCLAGSQAPESFGSVSPATSCFREFNVARERKMCSPLVSRKGNQEHGTKVARIVLLIQAAGQSVMVENPAELHLQQGPSLDRTWSQGRVQKGTSLCAKAFTAEICRPPRCGVRDSRTSQGPKDRGVIHVVICILCKLRAERPAAVLIVPVWPSQTWWSSLLALEEFHVDLPPPKFSVCPLLYTRGKRSNFSSTRGCV